MDFTARQGVGSLVPCPLEGCIPYSWNTLPPEYPNAYPTPPGYPLTLGYCIPFRCTQHQNQPTIWQIFWTKTAQNERNWT